MVKERNTDPIPMGLTIKSVRQVSMRCREARKHRLGVKREVIVMEGFLESVMPGLSLEG